MFMGQSNSFSLNLAASLLSPGALHLVAPLHPERTYRWMERAGNGRYGQVTFQRIRIKLSLRKSVEPAMFSSVSMCSYYQSHVSII